MSTSRQMPVLAIHPGALGDVILFGHLLRRLRGPVSLVAGCEKAHLLAGMGIVAEALDFDSLPMHEVFLPATVTSPAPGASAAAALAGRHGLAELLGGHERLVSCFAQGDPAAERRLAELCGVNEAAFLPTRPPADFAGHLLELWQGQIAGRGPEWLGRSAEVAQSWAKWEPETPSWPVPEAWRHEARSTLAAVGIEPDGPFAAFHPGAGSPAKCWPLERFAEVAEGLAARGLGAVFMVGPAERDRWGDGRMERLVAGRFGVLTCPALAALAGVLALATAYAGNDSGVTHLAAAVGTPTVALFGPTRADHFRPLGPRVTVLAARKLEETGPVQVLQALAP